MGLARSRAVTLGGETVDVIVREVTPTEAAVTTKWRYQGPWSVYDGKASDHLRSTSAHTSGEQYPELGRRAWCSP
jgi:hypothetical protein